MIILGGDLDLDGAIVALGQDGKYVGHIRFPTMEHNSPGVLKRRINCHSLVCQVKAFVSEKTVIDAYLEWPGVIASNGMLRSASQHRTLGDIETALAAAGVISTYFSVRDWKNNFGLIGKPKKAAIPIANDLCGMSLTKITEETPIAEAALIARYGMRKAQEAKCSR